MARRPTKRGGIRRNKVAKKEHDYISDAPEIWSRKRLFDGPLRALVEKEFYESEDVAFHLTEGMFRARSRALDTFNKLLKERDERVGKIKLVPRGMGITAGGKTLRCFCIMWGSEYNWKGYKFSVAQLMRDPTMMQGSRRMEWARMLPGKPAGEGEGDGTT